MLLKLIENKSCSEINFVKIWIYFLNFVITYGEGLEAQKGVKSSATWMVVNWFMIIL